MRNGRVVGISREKTGQEDKGMKPPSGVTPEEDITAAQVVPHITPETATETRHIGALTEDTVETDASTGRTHHRRHRHQRVSAPAAPEQPDQRCAGRAEAVQGMRLPGTAGRSIADCQRCDALAPSPHCLNNWSPSSLRMTTWWSSLPAMAKKGRSRLRIRLNLAGPTRIARVI